MDLLRALESGLSIQSPSDPGLSRDRHKSVGYGTGSGLRHSTPQDVGCQSLSFPHLEIGGISSVQFSCLVVSDSLQPHESHNSWGCNDDQRKKLGRA